MKIMFEKFFPDEYLGSTYKIPFEKLYEQGYRGVIFDIDNTLVTYDDLKAPEHTKKWFEMLHQNNILTLIYRNSYQIQQFL